MPDGMSESLSALQAEAVKNTFTNPERKVARKKVLARDLTNTRVEAALAPGNLGSSAEKAAYALKARQELELQQKADDEKVLEEVQKAAAKAENERLLKEAEAEIARQEIAAAREENARLLPIGEQEIAEQKRETEQTRRELLAAQRASQQESIARAIRLADLNQAAPEEVEEVSAKMASLKKKAAAA